MKKVQMLLIFIFVSFTLACAHTMPPKTVLPIKAIQPPSATQPSEVDDDEDEKSPTGPFAVTVDYDLTYAQAIKAGDYDKADVNIKMLMEHYPPVLKGRAVVQFHMVPLGKATTVTQLLAEMNRRNLRPATLHELLALGASKPELQQQLTLIMAAGSLWKRPSGALDIPILVAHHGTRYFGEGTLPPEGLLHDPEGRDPAPWFAAVSDSK